MTLRHCRLEEVLKQKHSDWIEQSLENDLRARRFIQKAVESKIQNEEEEPYEMRN